MAKWKSELFSEGCSFSSLALWMWPWARALNTQLSKILIVYLPCSDIFPSLHVHTIRMSCSLYNFSTFGTDIQNGFVRIYISTSFSQHFIEHFISPNKNLMAHYQTNMTQKRMTTELMLRLSDLIHKLTNSVWNMGLLQGGRQVQNDITVAQGSDQILWTSHDQNQKTGESWLAVTWALSDYDPWTASVKMAATWDGQERVDFAT